MTQHPKPIALKDTQELLTLHNPKFPTNFHGSIGKGKAGESEYTHYNDFTSSYELVYRRTDHTRTVVDSRGTEFEAVVFEFERIRQA